MTTEGANQQMQSIALHDDESKVRLSAIAKITSAESLIALYADDLTNTSALRDAVLARLCQLMSDDQLDTAELNQCLQASIPDAATLLVTHSANSDFRAKTLQQINDETQLLSVINNSRFHDTRLAAAENLKDDNLIRQAAAACRSRDKVVAKFLQQKIDEKTAIAEQHKHNVQTATDTVDAVEQLATSVWSPQSEGKFNALNAKWNVLADQYKQPLSARFDKASNTIKAQLEERVKAAQEQAIQEEGTNTAAIKQNEQLQSDSEASADIKAAQPQVEIDPALTELINALAPVAIADVPGFVTGNSVPNASLAEKVLAHASAVAVMFDPPYEVNKGRPSAVEQRIKRVKTLLDTDSLLPGVPVQQCRYVTELAEHLAQLEDRLGKAKQESSDRVKATHKQFAALAATVKEGKWGPASSMFRRLHKKVEAMEPAEKNVFADKLSRAEKELDEMADWQDFAAKPKLEALCVEMEALPENELKPEELAKRIKKLQANWKSLGVSRAANELWARFKTAGDTAYEPCKAYFEEKQTERQLKLDAKHALCEQLNQTYESADWENPDWRNLQRAVNNAKRDWSRNRVPDRKPDRALEQKFSDALKPLEEKLAEQYDVNAELKRELVEKAEKLATSEITQHSVNQARSLQSAWKQVGIMRRKDDQALWELFNGHCKVIYKHKHDTEKEKYKASMSHVFRARDIIKTLRSMAKTADIDEPKLQALQSEFQALEAFPDKDKKFLLKDFRAAIDACQRSQENLSKKRVLAERDEIQRRIGLCEQLEAGVESPQLIDANQLEDIEHAWDSSDAPISRDVLALLSSRRNAALEHLKTGTKYDYEKNEVARRELLIQMEILTEKETPAEDKARRMQYQLSNLTIGMTSSAVIDKRAELQDLQLKWYAAAPVMQSVKDNLQSRFLNIINK